MVGGGDGAALDLNVDERLVAVSSDQPGHLARAALAGFGVGCPDEIAEVDVLDRLGGAVGHKHGRARNEAVARGREPTCCLWGESLNVLTVHLHCLGQYLHTSAVIKVDLEVLQ